MIDDDLNNLSNDELERLEKMLNILKLQQEINNAHELNLATIEQMRIENDKYRAETAKLNKENKLYPYVIIGCSILSGVIAALITHWLK